MSSGRHPIWEALDGAQQDLRAATAKLVAIRAFVAQIDIPEQGKFRCPECDTTFQRSTDLAEHRYRVHAAELPAHWARADQIAAEPERSER